MQHLSYEDIERFLDDTDLSDEYLIWLDEIMEHLDGCKFCQEKIEHARNISVICAEENTGAVTELLQREPILYNQLAAQRLEQIYQQTRIRQAAERLKEGLLIQMMILKSDLLCQKSAVRGTEEEICSEVQVRYDKDRILVVVPCQRRTDVVVILVRNDNGMMESKATEAVWSETECGMIAEFAEVQPAEAYEIYIDMQE